MTGVLSLAQELAEVTRLVAGDDVSSALGRFVARATDTVPGCAHASITVRTHRGDFETVGEHPVNLLVPGPVTEALIHHEPRRLDDAAADERWPTFSTQLLLAGWCGCLVLPIPTSERGQAVFTLFSREPDQFDALSYDFVMLLALNAGVVFDNVSLYHHSTGLVEQLRTALTTRATIGQAQGLLMQRFGFDADTAFETLTRASQNSNRKLRDVAAAMVTAHENRALQATLQEFQLSTPDPV
ncbi:GAF and ANTAR domain-containing protein [Actinokineospora globicatena]|uniref:GAF and ANTAR domain-containing protein n=1 Tax=Actinokineospora globicatena TaxID=103729 RepID=UPI0020A32061|nr:GAF and ANTAR domain-containing protein [Actinokineospora globicatena]MCP2304486.1 ANTAR domain-containing protein [Actinokineospora globicatena]GLW78148.1 ANTAR domain-containing protein [Actinokineospora globicatena]GLW85186.1 ANTAR domain-containing protein [Actinokineospora globicatena]